MKESEALEIMSYDHSGELTLDETYSGRGMFGKTTYAIICDDLIDFDNACIDALGKASSSYRKDNMGKGYVIY